MISWVVMALIPITLPEVRIELGLPNLPNNIEPLNAGWPILLFLCALYRMPQFGLLGSRILRFYGAIYFSLCLIHWPVLEFIRSLEMGALNNNPLGIIVVLGSGPIKGIPKSSLMRFTGNAEEALS